MLRYYGRFSFVLLSHRQQHSRGYLPVVQELICLGYLYGRVVPVLRIPGIRNSSGSIIVLLQFRRKMSRSAIEFHFFRQIVLRAGVRSLISRQQGTQK